VVGLVVVVVAVVVGLAVVGAEVVGAVVVGAVVAGVVGELLAHPDRIRATSSRIASGTINLRIIFSASSLKFSIFSRTDTRSGNILFVTRLPPSLLFYELEQI